MFQFGQQVTDEVISFASIMRTRATGRPSSTTSHRTFGDLPLL